MHAVTEFVNSYGPGCALEYFPMSCTIIASYNLLISSSAYTTETLREGCNRDISTRDEHCEVAHILSFVLLWVSVLTTIYYKNKLL